MKLIQVLANGLLALGFLAGTAHGSILPYASVSSAVIVEDIQYITELSNSLRQIAVGITRWTIARSGKAAVDGLKQIVNAWSDDLKKWESSSKSLWIQGAPITDPADAKPICAAFHAFVEAHKAAVVALTDKSSEFGKTPLQSPMVAALRDDEAIVDAVVYYFFDAVPPCRADVKQDWQTLEVSLLEAVGAYESGFLFNLDRDYILPHVSASSAVIVEDIQYITNLSNSLRQTAVGITRGTIAGSGKAAIDGLKQIVNPWSDDLQKWGSSSFTNPADAKPICAAFHAFVEAHQNALVLLIDKRPAFSFTPFDSPMAAALRQDEHIVDSIAYYLIDAVPPCGADIEKDLRSIEASLKSALDAFEQFIVFNLHRGTDLKEYL
ncbi:hypothetical protein MMC07_001666 [Pseudocyphellaria aurata]|nr:hypothetical protein [Pseudocyphellaria aurata]